MIDRILNYQFNALYMCVPVRGSMKPNLSLCIFDVSSVICRRGISTIVES